MQIQKDQLKAQQTVLAFLGYYKGKIDGIWGASSMDAKKRFERDPSYVPSAPTFGMPWPYRVKLPKGMFWDKMCVSHTRMTKDDVARITGGTRESNTKVDTNTTKYNAAKSDTQAENGSGTSGNSTTESEDTTVLPVSET